MTKAIAGVAAVITLISIMLMVAEKRDKAVMASAKAYEQCVAREYGTTPTRFYAEQGRYPECNL